MDTDAIEAVILLPDNLFFNTSAPGIILVASKVDGEHPRNYAGEILLINASKFCEKGRPKNYMTDAQVAQVADLFLNWKAEENVSIIIKQTEVVRNDYNLNPSRYVVNNDVEPLPSLEEAWVLLREAEEVRQEADLKFKRVMGVLGLTASHESS